MYVVLFGVEKFSKNLFRRENIGGELDWSYFEYLKLQASSVGRDKCVIFTFHKCDVSYLNYFEAAFTINCGRFTVLFL